MHSDCVWTEIIKICEEEWVHVQNILFSSWRLNKAISEKEENKRVVNFLSLKNVWWNIDNSLKVKISSGGKWNFQTRNTRDKQKVWPSSSSPLSTSSSSLPYLIIFPAVSSSLTLCNAFVFAVSGNEDCLWYVDKNGTWHNGFDCPLITFCCGNCHRRYCCLDAFKMITEREQKRCMLFQFRWGQRDFHLIT